MKKFILLIAIFLICGIGYSQEEGKNGSTMGIVGGYNVSDVRVSGSDMGSAGASNAAGFYAGFLWEQKLIPLLRLQSGIKYVKNGYESGNDRVVLNYITVPITAKVNRWCIWRLSCG